MNHFFGKKHSLKTKAKMRLAWRRTRKTRLLKLRKAAKRRRNNPRIRAAQIARNKEMAKSPKWRTAVHAQRPWGVPKPKLKRGPKIKTVEGYEKEAKQVGKCLVHSSRGVARRIYEMRHGKYFPRGNSGGLRVCHTCDVPNCILDVHHFLGTQKDNVQDAVKKKRHSGFRKGGVRFSGPHKKSTKLKIAMASRNMWSRRKNVA